MRPTPERMSALRDRYGDLRPPAQWSELIVGPAAAAEHRHKNGNALYSKVLSLKDALSREECEALMTEADEHMAAGLRFTAAGGDDAVPHDAPRRRVQLEHMHEGAKARDVFEALMARLFAFLEADVPGVAHACFGCCSNLAAMPRVFNTVEPTINVYTAGGSFASHQDGQHLTVLVHLSAEGSFDGGGTAYWRESYAREWLGRGLDGVAPDAVVHPQQGEALLWNGELVHAGCAVEAGTRHILVGSFSLYERIEPGPGLSRRLVRASQPAPAQRPSPSAEGKCGGEVPRAWPRGDDPDPSPGHLAHMSPSRPRRAT